MSSGMGLSMWNRMPQSAASTTPSPTLRAAEMFLQPESFTAASVCGSVTICLVEPISATWPSEMTQMRSQKRNDSSMSWLT